MTAMTQFSGRNRQSLWQPFPTSAETARARRRLAASLVIMVGAAVLAAFTSRTVGDERTVTLYLVAAGIHLVVALGTALRLSATGGPGQPAR